SQGRGVQIVRQSTDVVERLFERNHVGILHRHVEQINLVRSLAAVENTLFDHRDFQVIGERVDDTGAHAAAGGGAAHQQTVGADFSQHAHERRAEKSAGLLL